LALAVPLGVALAVGVADGDVDVFVVAFADAVLVGVAVGLLASLAETSEVDAFAVALGLELADGDGDPVGVAVLLADPLGVGDGDPVALAAGAVETPVYASLSSTGRKASLAVVSIRLTTLVAALPGTVTVIWSLPCVWTCAPELPVPLTRFSSTPTDACMAWADGTAPFGVAALSTTWVPLDRSRPSATLNWLCQLPGLKVWPPRIEISMIKISAASPASARPGREPLLLGGATYRLPG
jgi:hypothetical protein